MISLCSHISANPSNEGPRGTHSRIYVRNARILHYASRGWEGRPAYKEKAGIPSPMPLFHPCVPVSSRDDVRAIYPKCRSDGSIHGHPNTAFGHLRVLF